MVDSHGYYEIAAKSLVLVKEGSVMFTPLTSLSRELKNSIKFAPKFAFLFLVRGKAGRLPFDVGLSEIYFNQKNCRILAVKNGSFSRKECERSTPSLRESIDTYARDKIYLTGSDATPPILREGGEIRDDSCPNFCPNFCLAPFPFLDSISKLVLDDNHNLLLEHMLLRHPEFGYSYIIRFIETGLIETVSANVFQILVRRYKNWFVPLNFIERNIQLTPDEQNKLFKPEDSLRTLCIKKILFNRVNYTNQLPTLIIELIKNLRYDLYRETCSLRE